MMELESLTVSRLSNLEMGQLIKSTLRDLRNLTPAEISNVVLANYLVQLDNLIENYDKGTLQVLKSEETIKIENADKIRDRAITSAQRMLSVYEFSDIEMELDAYASLDILFNTYKGIQGWNYEEETNGIDNLIAELNSPKYLPMAGLLQLNRYVVRMQTTNEAFKLIFSKRNMTASSKEPINMKKLRTDLKTTYIKMCDYVFVMLANDPITNLTPAASTINTLRKYYADMLSKRKSNKDDDTEV